MLTRARAELERRLSSSRVDMSLERQSDAMLVISTEIDSEDSSSEDNEPISDSGSSTENSAQDEA